MDSTRSIVPLYSWLIDVKGYSDDDALETVLRYNGGFDIPESVRKDIEEYTEEFIVTFGWGYPK